MSDSRTQCIILAACLFLFPIVLMAQVGDSTKLLTPGVGCELGFGSNGHADVQLAIRINTPSFEHLVWGFSLQGGLMLHNTSDYYYSDNPNSSYDDVKDWYSFAFSLQAGYEFKPSGDVNPFVMVGYGFWEYSFIAANDSSEVNVGGKTGSFVPVLIGCDFKVLKFLRITPFAKVDVYIDDMEEVLYPCDPKVCTLLIPPEPKDINKWRGTFSTGVDISIPLYLRH